MNRTNTTSDNREMQNSKLIKMGNATGYNECMSHHAWQGGSMVKQLPLIIKRFYQTPHIHTVRYFPDAKV